MTTSSSDFAPITLDTRDGPVTFVPAFASATIAAAYLRSADARGLRVSAFAKDLANSRRTLSPKQSAWVLKLATDLVLRDPQASVYGARPGVVETAKPGLDGSAIVALLKRAAVANKRLPKITVSDTDGNRIVATLCGSGSRTPGSVRLTNGVAYGEHGAVFYGTIDPRGLVQARDSFAAVRPLFEALVADPARVMAQHGVRTGRCSICGRPLSTKESCSVGYGPDCAEKCGLPWGAIDPALEAAHEAASAPIVVESLPSGMAPAAAPAEPEEAPEPEPLAPCPMCGGEPTPLGMLGSTVWCRCRHCGSEWTA